MRDEILRAMTEGYGDATVTPLDREVAEKVEAAVLPFICSIIAAAGGEVTIPMRDLIDPPVYTLFRDEHASMDGIRFHVRANAETSR